MTVHDDISAFLSFYSEQPEPKRMVGYSKFAKVHFAQEGLYGPGTWLLFGSEVSGLPKEVGLMCGSSVNRNVTHFRVALENVSISISL